MLAGEQKTIDFEINTEDLKFVDVKNQWVVEPEPPLGSGCRLVQGFFPCDVSKYRYKGKD